MLEEQPRYIGSFNKLEGWIFIRVTDYGHIGHSQLLNITILKLNSPVLLNLLGNIFPYCRAVEAIRVLN